VRDYVEGRMGPGIVQAVLVAVGFGIFRGASTSSYLSTFSDSGAPFLFVSDVLFNIAAALAAAVTSFLVVFKLLKRGGSLAVLPVALPTLMLVLCCLASSTGLLSTYDSSVVTVAGGIAFGFSSIIVTLAWAEIVAQGYARAIAARLAGAVLIGTAVSALLGNCSVFFRAPIGAVLLVVSSVLLLKMRSVVLPTPQLAEKTDAHDAPGSIRAAWSLYGDALSDLADSLAAFFVLEAVIGLLNSFMYVNGISFPASGSVSVIAPLCAAGVFCVFVFWLENIPTASTVFRAMVSPLAAMAVFLPFISETYNLVFLFALLVGYSVVGVLAAYRCMTAASTYRLSPDVLLGFSSGIASVCLLVALVVGWLAGSIQGGFGDGAGTMRYLVVVVAVVYALVLTTVFLSRNRAASRFSLRHPRQAAMDAAESSALAPDETVSALDGCIADIIETYGLTEREGDVIACLARGRSNSNIAKKLFISENTVRSHVRSIYSKLNVHTRQQVIDMVEETIGGPAL